MAIGRSPDKERVYVLREDQELPSDQQTRWFYRALTVGDMEEVQSAAIESRMPVRRRGFRDKKGEQEQRTVYKSTESTILRKGLVRVENFKDEDGNPVVWNPEAGKDAQLKFLSYLTADQRAELSDVITGDTDLAKEERGNSRWAHSSTAASGDGNVRTMAANAPDASSSTH